MRCPGPEPEPGPTAPAGVIAGEDCIRAAHAWLDQQWQAIIAHLADVDEAAERNGRTDA